MKNAPNRYTYRASNPAAHVHPLGLRDEGKRKRAKLTECRGKVVHDAAFWLLANIASIGFAKELAILGCAATNPEFFVPCVIAVLGVMEPVELTAIKACGYAFDEEWKECDCKYGE